MSYSIPTLDGFREPTADDCAYMEYLDDHAELPGGHSFGLLLFKGDPSAFRMGLAEWLMERETECEETARAAGFIQSDADHGAIGKPADIDAGNFDDTYSSWHECCEANDL